MYYKNIKNGYLKNLIITTGLILSLFPNPSFSIDKLQLIWQKQVDSSIHLPPKMSKKYVITSTSKGKVYCYFRASGKLNWVLDSKPRFWDRSLLVSEDKFYIGRAGGILQAYNIDNAKLLWQKKLTADVQTQVLLVKDTLYVPTTYVGPELSNDPHGKAVFYALDSKSGDILWRKQTKNYALQTPAYFDKKIYLAGSYYDPSIEIDEGGPMRVTALKENNGETIWQYKAVDGFVKSIYADENSISYVAYQDYINALNPLDGSLTWRSDTGNWVPALLGKKEIIFYGSATTNVYAISSKTGAVKWKFNIGGGSFNYLLGKPVLTQNILYFLSQQGDIYALESNTGNLKWQESTQLDSRTGLSVDGIDIVIGSIDGVIRLYKFN